MQRLIVCAAFVCACHPSATEKPAPNTDGWACYSFGVGGADYPEGHVTHCAPSRAACASAQADKYKGFMRSANVHYNDFGNCERVARVYCEDLDIDKTGMTCARSAHDCETLQDNGNALPCIAHHDGERLALATPRPFAPSAPLPVVPMPPANSGELGEDEVAWAINLQERTSKDNYQPTNEERERYMAIDAKISRARARGERLPARTPADNRPSEPAKTGPTDDEILDVAVESVKRQLQAEGYILEATSGDHIGEFRTHDVTLLIDRRKDYWVDAFMMATSAKFRGTVSYYDGPTSDTHKDGTLAAPTSQVFAGRTIQLIDGSLSDEKEGSMFLKFTCDCDPASAIRVVIMQRRRAR